jgi:hypothetical protein
MTAGPWPAVSCFLGLIFGVANGGSCARQLKLTPAAARACGCLGVINSNAFRERVLRVERAQCEDPSRACLGQVPRSQGDDWVLEPHRAPLRLPNSPGRSDLGPRRVQRVHRSHNATAPALSRKVLPGDQVEDVLGGNFRKVAASVWNCFGSLVQLASRRRASSDGEPGSAVWRPRVWSGSPVGARAS